MEFLLDYLLFLFKALTVVLAIGAVIVMIAMATVKPKAKKGELVFEDLSEDYQALVSGLQAELMDKKAYKEWQKSAKKQLDTKPTNKLYVIDFHGSIDAKEVDALREEITAVLAVAQPSDEVLVRLESGGGAVHGYGLAASQLDRLRQQQIPLTIAIDKVAASGGYMMACIANKIISAPFAIVGSIGVVAQVPNFHQLLKKNHIEVEQFTAGEFKRTVTLFGENTEKGRKKFQHELEECHQLFKDFVHRHRPVLDIDQVATGEHWFGYQALQYALIDHIQTSDDYLLQQMATRQVYLVKYQLKKGLAEKVGLSAANIVTHLWQQADRLVIWR